MNSTKMQISFSYMKKCNRQLALQHPPRLATATHSRWRVRSDTLWQPERGSNRCLELQYQASSLSSPKLIYKKAGLIETVDWH
jgi:hypothetical protein